MPFTYLHVFTYSERPGTPAATIADAVPIHIRRERNAILRDLASVKNRTFRQRFTGRTVSAVTLMNGHAALSDNYLHVDLATERPPNQLIDIKIGGLTDTGLIEANALRVIA